MTRCEDCIHEKICHHRVNIQTDTYAYMGIKYDTEKCEHYMTKDVVPKSEVDILVRDLRFKNIECDLLREQITKAKQEVAREIFEEIDELDIQLNNGDLDIKYFGSAVAELKKKYCESEDK